MSNLTLSQARELTPSVLENRRNRYINVYESDVPATVQADVDVVAVERAVNGDRPARMYTADKLAAVYILINLGFTLTAAAATVGVSNETVQRWQLNEWDPVGVLVPLRSPRVLIPCPSPAAYKRHLAHGEKPCASCTAANSAADRRRFLRAV